jgi:hypothetical protein
MSAVSKYAIAASLVADNTPVDPLLAAVPVFTARTALSITGLVSPAISHTTPSLKVGAVPEYENEIVVVPAVAVRNAPTSDFVPLWFVPVSVRMPRPESVKVPAPLTVTPVVAGSNIIATASTLPAALAVIEMLDIPAEPLLFHFTCGNVIAI